MVSIEHLQLVRHSRHLVPSPIVGLACAPIVETKFLEPALSLLDFSHRIPLGTFSISLTIKVIPMSLVIYNIFLTAAGLDRYCTCTYFSKIHILVKLALHICTQNLPPPLIILHHSQNQIFSPSPLIKIHATLQTYNFHHKTIHP